MFVWAHLFIAQQLWSTHPCAGTISINTCGTSSQGSYSRALSPPHPSPSADVQVHTPVLGLRPTDLSPLVEHQTVHLPILVTHAGGTFHVLPLSPPPLHTPFDLILPPPHCILCSRERIFCSVSSFRHRPLQLACHFQVDPTA
jgi:hypothetical protein